MPDQADILSGASTPVSTTPADTTTIDTAPVTQQPSYVDQLRTIKNDDGLQKYASIEDALTGTAHAQDFIKTLKNEKADLEAQLETIRNQQEAMTQTAYTQTTPATAEKGLGVDDVYSLMKEYETGKVRESNLKSVGNTLLANCNNDKAKAEEVLTKRLSELNMSRAHLNTLAATSPDAVFELLKLDAKGRSSDYTSGTINPDAIEAHTKREVPRAKALPIGASSSHLVSAWRDAIADVNN
tara:strand:+ start:1363 stop:2085 length:723 start_codon:yes stop_codon:yes gene_type:complete